MLDLESLLAQADQLPALPQLYTEVIDLLDNEQSTAKQIGELIQTDASITSRILRIVNSAYYGLRYPVSSISRTVALLGNQRLKQIMFRSVLRDVFRSYLTTDYAIEAFWIHSVKTAIIGRHLALQNSRIIDHDTLFTAGLLHDIGKMVIARALPELRAEIDGLEETESISSVAAEQRILGFDHTDIGEALLRKWGLPDMLVECVKNHHLDSHEGEYAVDSSIIYLANQLSHYETPARATLEAELEASLEANLEAAITRSLDVTVSPKTEKWVAPAPLEETVPDLLANVSNWRESGCTLEQIHVAWRLAEEQYSDVMEELGLNEFDQR